MSEPYSAEAKAIVQAVVRDLADTAGLGNAWNNIGPTTKKELIARWAVLADEAVRKTTTSDPSLLGKIVIGGTYRHFKGGTYKVLSVVHDCEHWDRLLVIYELMGPETYRASREIGAFLSEVDKPDFHGLRFTLLD